MNINLAARPLTADETAALTKLPKARLVLLIATSDCYPTEGQIKVWNRENKTKLLQVIGIRHANGRTDMPRLVAEALAA